MGAGAVRADDAGSDVSPPTVSPPTVSPPTDVGGTKFWPKLKLARRCFTEAPPRALFGALGAEAAGAEAGADISPRKANVERAP